MGRANKGQSAVTAQFMRGDPQSEPISKAAIAGEIAKRATIAKRGVTAAEEPEFSDPIGALIGVLAGPLDRGAVAFHGVGGEPAKGVVAPGPSVLSRSGVLTPHGSSTSDAEVQKLSPEFQLAVTLGGVIESLEAQLAAKEREIAALKQALAARDAVPAEVAEDEAAPLWNGTEEDLLASFMASPETVSRRLADDPSMLDGAAFGERIGCSRQAVQQKRARREVIGLQQAKRKVWYPLSQVDGNGRILEGVAELLRAFDGDEWRAQEFLVSPQVGLDGVSGREALLSGRKDEVLTVVQGIREGGFG